jgi:hypothetical protein
LALPETNKKRKRSDLQEGEKDDLSQVVDHREPGQAPNEGSDKRKETSSTKLPEFMTALNEKFDPEYLAALERFYWRNLSFQNTMYGADLEGSIFTDNPENKWDMRSLESILSEVKINVPGVTTPYLYFGMYKATFSWHVEDMDLFSINYLHFGAPKMWYVVPPAERKKFETFAASYFFDEAQHCPEFMRHKSCVLSPTVLEKHNITCHRLVQRANEFVITFPGGYHQGWNTDFNCAEAINFATPAWINFGRAAGFCECVQDSVAIDVNGIFGVDEDFKMPRPKAKPKKRAPLPMYLPSLSTKRKNVTKGKSSKKAKKTTSAFVEEKKEWTLPHPRCCLCPLGDSEEFPLMPTNRKGVWAHVECGAYIPETSVEMIEEGLALIGDQIALEEQKATNDEAHGVTNPEVSTEHLDAEKGCQKHNAHAEESNDVSLDESTSKFDKKIAPYRIVDVEKVISDRKRLKCAYCQWQGPPRKDLGACIQCCKVILH